jgi:hypothetical protein
MVRRLGAVAAGVIACQVSMIVSLALAMLMVLALPELPPPVLVVIAVLMLLPGVAGGSLTGLLADRHGPLYGMAAALIFGISIVLVKAWVAPGLGYGASPSDLVIYPALLVGLGVAGAAGGALGMRRRAGPPASPRPARQQPAG